MHLLLTACGSYGDVIPMLELAKAASAHGHHATVITNPHFRPMIEKAGIEFSALGTAEEYDSLIQHPDLWHPFRGPKLVLNFGASGLLRKLYKAVAANYRPGETVLAAHGLDMASRVFQEKHQAPLATVHFAPLSIRSYDEVPNFIGMLTSAGVPRWLKVAQFWVADRLVIDPIINPHMDPLRAELELPCVRRYYGGWANSPQLVLGLFPDWFAPPQNDWPSNTALTGFPLSGGDRQESLSPDVEEFLAAGEPPIVFAPGSANAQAPEFFRTAVDVCQRLRRRGLLLTKYPDQLPDALPGNLMHGEFVPFGALLPRAAAVVHHGGIGSCANGLAAGIPQLAMPMAYDQLDNATRLQRLGVGECLPVKKFQPNQVERLLARLLNSKDVAGRCRDYAERCNGSDGLESACDLLEDLLTRRVGSTRRRFGNR